MTFTEEVIKGSTAYKVTDASGKVVATSHCILVSADRYSLVVGGKFAGMGPRAAVVAKMKEMCK